MAFSRLSPTHPNSGIRTDKVRVIFIASNQNQTEIRIPSVVAQQLHFRPNEKKVGVTVELGNGEHLGLVRISRAGQGQQPSRTVNTKPTATLSIRLSVMKPFDSSKAMGATPVSYMVENGVLTLLLPSSRYDTAPTAIDYIRGEHAKSAAEPQAEAHSPAALNVPADL